ncbi:MAG: Ig-like domain-containing protein, partial [Pseudomonadota bacterium]
INPGDPNTASFAATSALGYDVDVFVGESGMLDIAVVQSDPDFDTLGLGETDTVTITYTISDGNGGTDDATAVLTVNGLNDDPTAVDDTFSVGEGELFTGSILGNDFDIDAPDTIRIISANGNVLAPVNPGDPNTTTFIANSVGGRQADVFIGESGTLDIAVVQGQDFFELAAGETDTIIISYEIEDNNGGTDTATATLTVVGDGPATIVSNFTSNTPNTGQEVTISLTTDSTTSDGTVDAEIDINFGAVLQPEINVVYVVDTSGSTIASVLAQEVAALQTLTADIAAQGFPEGSVTISIVPFSTTSAPDATGDDVSTFTLDTTDDAGTTDVDDISAALGALSGGGFTNYVEALGATVDLLNTVDPSGNETNVVYFLSDGQPFASTATGNQTEAEIAAAAAPLHAIAQVSAFEIGDVDALQFLDALDNTGGAESVTSPSDLSAALLGSPIPEGTVIAADLFIFDDSDVFGTLVDTISFDVPGGTDDPANPNLVETPLGLEIDLMLSGLASDLGDANRASLVVQFDDDGDGIVDLPLFVEVDIFGTTA